MKSTTPNHLGMKPVTFFMNESLNRSQLIRSATLIHSGMKGAISESLDRLLKRFIQQH